MRYAYTLEQIEERFWPKVDATGDCWTWTGTFGDNGYGHLYVGDRTCALVHRISLEMTGQEIPPGWQVDHRCFVRSCVNPAHLEAVTPAENIYRSSSPSALNRAKDRCIRGHLFDASRVCRECKLIRQREAYVPVANGPGPGGRQKAKTTCPQGHRYDVENTYVTRAGKRMCRECMRSRTRARRAALKEVES